VKVEEVRFDANGLVPAIVQSSKDSKVLMIAYMNRESLDMSLESGQAHFYSRSRKKLWHKGETSGNIQHVKQILVDCDGDALLVLVDEAGPACHTGERSCFDNFLPLEKS
jgi:phosphoribosyl-ATP pyrophosphohydrolase/phosphoribosyl-AMP cyclohydrolase